MFQWWVRAWERLAVFMKIVDDTVKEEVNGNRQIQLSMLRLLAVHIGYVHGFCDPRRYPSLYTGEEAPIRMNKDAYAEWNALPSSWQAIISVPEFVQDFSTGWANGWGDRRDAKI
jgi:hypothetical protein